MLVRNLDESIPGLLLVEPQVFRDRRGFFLETFHRDKYRAAGIRGPFLQDNHSHSVHGTLRGLHYQLRHPQGKLIYVVKGEIFDVAVDIRRGSPTFGRWAATILSSENKCQLYIPEGFAHGFSVLSESADIIYKCTDLYDPEDEYGILWSDPSIGIDWPLRDPILSDKDRRNPELKDVPVTFLPVLRP
ncbi:MAG: dTDP-4-dehydrorhamnose 3,5-epimerase [Deltaproteobacteria bacterium]|nr:dTDP-4-dehydrorhamnose 3,5-epimerase [Deltaproteobacteria bacterium]MBW2018127.1 dTDP-4-dehydrorhamnose 3,5-epimerase [Deltaproteobacteria bacterium]MBW2129419.1 dTDP-4-dehydrorhamnose 3,5-epimerase [Deltaproteobacteria bacterium]MBW2302948.1 dTDP-4-dehydrorhamnose 3,5-epimerase [Deltaproteobacteria bacterium]